MARCFSSKRQKAFPAEREVSLNELFLLFEEVAALSYKHFDKLSAATRNDFPSEGISTTGFHGKYGHGDLA